MPSKDYSEQWICIGKECGILLGNPNELKYLITPLVTSSKTYLPNYRDSTLKRFDPPNLDTSLHSLLEEVTPWLLDMFGLKEGLLSTILDAFNEVIDEGFAYKLEMSDSAKTSRKEEISMYETGLPSLIGRSTELFIKHSKQSPNDCDACELSDFVSRKIILALYFDLSKVLPTGIPSGISGSFEKVLCMNSFIGIVISLVKKIVDYPEVELSLLWKFVDSTVRCWENYPEKPSLLSGSIRDQLKIFIPRLTYPQNLELVDNILPIDNADITITKEPVASNYFSSSFPSKTYLGMQRKATLSNSFDESDTLQKSTSSVCVAMSSSASVSEKLDLIGTLPRRKEICLRIGSVSGSISLDLEQYSIDICYNMKVSYILACVVLQVRPTSMCIGTAMCAIKDRIEELRMDNSSKHSISVRHLLAGLIGDQSFLTPVCLLIFNGFVFLINFGPKVTLDFLRPTSIGCYMKFGLVAEQALGHPL